MPQGPSGLPEPDPGAVLALACHCVMVDCGLKVGTWSSSRAADMHVSSAGAMQHFIESAAALQTLSAGACLCSTSLPLCIHHHDLKRKMLHASTNIHYILLLVLIVGSWPCSASSLVAVTPRAGGRCLPSGQCSSRTSGCSSKLTCLSCSSQCLSTSFTVLGCSICSTALQAC